MYHNDADTCRASFPIEEKNYLVLGKRVHYSSMGNDSKKVMYLNDKHTTITCQKKFFNRILQCFLVYQLKHNYYGLFYYFLAPNKPAMRFD